MLFNSASGAEPNPPGFREEGGGGPGPSSLVELWQNTVVIPKGCSALRGTSAETSLPRWKLSVKKWLAKNFGARASPAPSCHPLPGEPGSRENKPQRLPSAVPQVSKGATAGDFCRRTQ